MKKIFLLALVSALCLGIQAAPKKKKDKKNKKAQVEKVDTVDVKTFSYLIGRLNTQGLVEYLTRQKGVDPKYMEQFIEGLARQNSPKPTIRQRHASQAPRFART